MDIQEIKTYMKANKITYDELAARSRLSISTIKKIFSGISKYPRIDTIQTIERALGLDKRESDFSEEEKKLASLIAELTEEEVKELSNFVDYIISKRK
jgi:transcriptional regulator with XRE-family HTH domain